MKANLHYNELKSRSCQEPKDCGIMLVGWGLKENTEIPGKAVMTVKKTTPVCNQSFCSSCEQVCIYKYCSVFVSMPVCQDDICDFRAI